jgi:CRP-like cAMP-binding protein
MGFNHTHNLKIMERLLQFLESIHPLSALLKEHLTLILKVKELPKKQMLLKAGHICRMICFVERGLLRCYYSVGDTEISSWFMKEGDVIVSIESFYKQKESYESIQALEDCTLYYIEYNELQHIYKEFPEFNFIGRVLTEKYYTLWAQQLYALRMQHAQERYNWLLDGYPDLILRVPAKYIASYLGITEAHLSVIKSKR